MGAAEPLQPRWFRATEFHRRCDDNLNTLRLILNTDWTVFGSFTPVEWKSIKWRS
jgi:hypothetical protein